MTRDTGDRQAILVASAGEPFPPEVLNRVRNLAGDRRPPVLVVTIARIWGTSLGLPHPGLYPTRQEMAEQQRRVEAAGTALAEEGFEVRTAVIRARNASKAIARYAENDNCRAVVVADPGSTRWQRILFGDVPREIKRRTSIPVEPVGSSGR